MKISEDYETTNMTVLEIIWDIINQVNLVYVYVYINLYIVFFI